MASTYTTNVGVEKPATGDQAGSWSTTVNKNYDIFDQAISGIVSVTLAAAGTSGAPNTLAITNAALSDGRNKFITFTDGGDLGADVFVQLTPNDAEKVCYIQNSLSGSQDLYLFQGTYNASRDHVVTAGTTVQVKFSGGGASASTVTEVMGTLNPGVELLLTERADHSFTPVATKGIVWLRSDTPNILMFTDDAGTDFTLSTAPTGKQTVYVSRASMTSPLTSGAAAGQVETTAGRPDIDTLDFDASADEYAQFSIAMPKQWNEGTVTFKVFWSSTATDNDGVSWALQGVSVADGDTIDVAYGTAVVVDDANQSTAQDVYISIESGAVTIAGSPAEGELTYFQIFRDVSDANDTAAEDAKLIGIQVFWTNNTTVDD